uniref:Uncharacterized protein n=1 Tax=Palpitomonas bilix TaxID=652834 RepID=A0A7S3FZY2_9EUKA
MKNGWETPTHGNTVPVQTEAPARISCLYCGKATTWLPALRSAHIVLLYLALLDTAAWMALNPPCDTSGRPFPLEGGIELSPYMLFTLMTSVIRDVCPPSEEFVLRDQNCWHFFEDKRSWIAVLDFAPHRLRAGRSKYTSASC